MHFRGAPPQPAPARGGRGGGAASRRAPASCSRCADQRGHRQDASASTTCANRRDYDRRPTSELAELRRALAEHLPTIRSRRRRAAPARLDRPAPHAAPRHAHGRDHDARPPRPPAADAAAAAADRRLRLPARAHARTTCASRGRRRRETFTFGTRLTRVTRAAALARTSTRRSPTCPRCVEDADGGTRIGAALHEFLATPRYADRARGALTIVLSDGLERGDPALMVAAVRAALAAVAPVVVVVAAGAPTRTYRPVTRGMARDPRRRRRWPARATFQTLLEQGARAVSGYVDAHHHIWRGAGPAVAERADDPAHLRALRVAAATRLPGGRVRRRRARRTASRSRSTRRPTGRSTSSVDEVEWVHEPARGDGLAARDRRLRRPVQPARAGDVRRADRRLAADARLPPAAALARRTRRSASPSPPDAMLDPVFNENLERIAERGWVFELQAFPNQLRVRRRELLGDHPDVTFVIIHAGMPIEGEPWREFAARDRAVPEPQRQAVRPGHVHPPRRPGLDQDRDAGRRGRVRLGPRDVRHQLPDRKHLDRLL